MPALTYSCRPSILSPRCEQLDAALRADEIVGGGIGSAVLAMTDKGFQCAFS
ncbi:MAG: hypothetical protein KGR26_01510 [Cyanobacteria bacterium REEB65]|nr:hypothetical protein [Cyanobacteria bacterium REEB65]